MCKNKIDNKYRLFHSWGPFIDALYGIWFVRECSRCGKTKSIKPG